MLGMRPPLFKCCHLWAKLLCCPPPRHSRVSWQHATGHSEVVTTRDPPISSMWGIYFPAPTWEKRLSCNATQCDEPPVFRILCRKAAHCAVRQTCVTSPMVFHVFPVVFPCDEPCCSQDWRHFTWYWRRLVPSVCPAWVLIHSHQMDGPHCSLAIDDPLGNTAGYCCLVEIAAKSGPQTSPNPSVLKRTVDKDGLFVLFPRDCVANCHFTWQTSALSCALSPNKVQAATFPWAWNGGETRSMRPAASKLKMAPATHWDDIVRGENLRKPQKVGRNRSPQNGLRNGQSFFFEWFFCIFSCRSMARSAQVFIWRWSWFGKIPLRMANPIIRLQEQRRIWTVFHGCISMHKYALVT